MGRWLTLGCLLIASVALIGAPIGGAQPGAVSSAQSFDRVAFEVTVHENGSARFAFRYERTLNDTERGEFEAFAEHFNGNRTPLYTDFRNQSRALVAHGERATDRNMTAEDFTRRAHVTQGLNDVGVVEMSFEWTGFAVTNRSHLVVGDVFEGGLYLAPNQRLVFEAGDGLRFSAVAPPATQSGESLATSDTVTWQGERTFTDNRPRVALARTAVVGSGGEGEGTGETDGGNLTATVNASAAPGAEGTATPTASSQPLLTMLAVGFVTVLVVGLGAAVLWRRGGPGTPTTSTAEVESVGGNASGDASGPTTEEEGVVDDHQRVAELLREHDGRLRQSTIVEETGWSKSKVSMMLSEMEEEGRITKIRIGRENLVSLPGYEPDAARSPYED